MDTDQKWSIFKRGAGKRGKAATGVDRRKGKYVLRTQYRNPETNEIEKTERQFSKKDDAIDARDLWLRELEKTQGRSIKGQRMTFEILVKESSKELYKPSETINGVTIKGTRSPSFDYHLAPLLEYFGEKEIGGITAIDLDRYVRWRRD